MHFVAIKSQLFIPIVFNIVFDPLFDGFLGRRSSSWQPLVAAAGVAVPQLAQRPTLTQPVCTKRAGSHVVVNVAL